MSGGHMRALLEFVVACVGTQNGRGAAPAQTHPAYPSVWLSVRQQRSMSEPAQDTLRHAWYSADAAHIMRTFGSRMFLVKLLHDGERVATHLTESMTHDLKQADLEYLGVALSWKKM